MFTSVVLALLAAVLYGISDFFGGIGARRVPVIRATTIAYLFASLAIWASYGVVGGTWSQQAALWGAAAGLAAIVGFICFYAALAAGPISLAAPLIAVLSSFVPVAIAVALGERLAALAWAAVGLAILGAVLISVPRRDGAVRVLPKTIVLSVVSGVTLGLSVVALNLAPHESGVTPALVEIVLGLLLLVLVLMIGRLSGSVRAWLARLDPQGDVEPTRSRTSTVAPSAVAGILLGVANALILLALQAGSLAVVSVLVGLYPLATILLARVVLKERVTSVQLVGIVLALAASVILASN